MAEQILLPGFDDALEARDRLFFAILPDQASAERIAQLANHLKNTYHLQGEPLRTKRFHVSLLHVKDYFALPQDVVARAKEAASAIAVPSFELGFDRLMSFSGRHRDTEIDRDYPLVLLARDGVAELTRLRHSLAVAMMKAGLRRSERTHFTPHMTLLYDTRRDIEQAVASIRLTVREFVLVHSLVGETRYVLLGRWPLNGRYSVGSANSSAKISAKFGS